jgi:hypothetical protein
MSTKPIDASKHATQGLKAPDPHLTTPDDWIERDERLLPLTGVHPFNAQASTLDLVQVRSGTLLRRSLTLLRCETSHQSQ